MGLVVVLFFLFIVVGVDGIRGGLVITVMTLEVFLFFLLLMVRGVR